MCPKSHARERTVLKSRELEPSQRPGMVNRLPVKYYTALEKQGGEDGRKLGRIQEPDENKAVATTGAKTRKTKPQEFSDVNKCAEI